MKRIVTVLILSLVIVGCSSEKEKVIEELKPKEEGRYAISIFTNKNPSNTEYYEKAMEIMGSQKKSKFISVNFRYNNENNSEYKYDDVFNIENHPLFMVLDNSGIQLKTYKLNELEEFFTE
ncbi:hypothetical protein H0266_08175 [Halobacillus locisalis]|uniref:Uncharacterized protein n=1 Tax=Halobacillus locisalis TaxID=220753 RepID=A0A838CS15_9BACI|nr:hypothetical protein [Halobacillus locisalis]MBA2174867.1 hypothetical protein [Halobacillus locisalis]